MKELIQFLPLVAALSIAITPSMVLAQSHAEEVALKAVSGETVITDALKFELSTQNNAETHLSPSSAPIEGTVKKKRSLLGKIGAFLVDFFFSGDYYGDGYTSFTSG